MINRREFLGTGAMAGAGLLTFKVPLWAQGAPGPLNVTGVPLTGMINFDQFITNLMTQYSVPGGAVAVSRNGAIIVARGYGLLDLNDSNSAVNAGDLFRVASVSKPITATTVLKLSQDGLLDLGATAWDLLRNDYPLLPGKSLASEVDAITIRHLLQHSAGWDGSVYDPMFDVDNIAKAVGMTAPADKAAIVRYMWSQPLVNPPPGSKYAYANFHYCLLGRVIEHVTGQPYADYVTARTLLPLGALATVQGATFLSGRQQGEARYYPYKGQGQVSSVFPPFDLVDSPYGSFDLENMDSHGAWISSPVDLLAFINGVFQGQFLNAASLNAITTNRISSGTNAFYGLGWALTAAGSDFNIWHNGSLPGSTAILVRTTWSDNSDVCWAAVLNTRDQGLAINGALDSAMWSAVETLSPFPGPIFPVPWASRHGLAAAQYQEAFDDLLGRGFRLTSISGYGVDGKAEYAAVWKQTGGPDWQARHGLTSGEYQQAFDQFVRRGYRLHRVSGYSTDRSVLYAAIWDKSGGPVWEARHGMTAAVYQQAFNQLVSQGYRLTWVDGYAQGSTALYAAIWEQRSGAAWQARHGMTAAQYQQTFNLLVGQGYRLRHVSGYSLGSIDYYAAIWERSSGQIWEAHHRLTAVQYQQTFNALVWGKGYQLTEVCGYQVGAEVLYAAIWEKA